MGRHPTQTSGLAQGLPSSSHTGRAVLSGGVPATLRHATCAPLVALIPMSVRHGKVTNKPPRSFETVSSDFKPKSMHLCHV